MDSEKEYDTSHERKLKRKRSETKQSKEQKIKHAKKEPEKSLVNPNTSTMIKRAILPFLYSELLLIVFEYIAPLDFRFLKQITIQEQGEKTAFGLTNPDRIYLSTDELFVNDVGHCQVQVFCQTTGRFLRLLKTWHPKETNQTTCRVNELLVINEHLILSETNNEYKDKILTIIDHYTGKVVSSTNCQHYGNEAHKIVSYIPSVSPDLIALFTEYDQTYVFVYNEDRNLILVLNYPMLKLVTIFDGKKNAEGYDLEFKKINDQIKVTTRDAKQRAKQMMNDPNLFNGIKLLE